MANPLVITPPSPYSIPAPLGAPQAPSFSKRSRSQQDEFMCIVGCVLGIVVFLTSLITVLLLYSPDVAADETRTTLTEVLEDSNGGGTRVDSNTMVMPPETVLPPRSTSSESTRTEPRSTEPAMTETERTTEALSTGAGLVTTYAPDTPDTSDNPDTTYTTETPQAIAFQFPQRFRKAPRGPFLCTVSVNFTESSLLPEDGLCDIIFYESFYVKNSPLEWNDTGLDHFFELGRSMQHTSIGASFSPTGLKLSDDFDSGVLWSGLDKLRTMGVEHFGMLNLLAYSRSLGFDFADNLDILKGILEYIHGDYPDGYAVVGLRFLSNDYDHPFSYM
ncbi:hypothetical protein MTO96_040227, partial [Rhipicephalus appendiculatus]